MFGLIAIKKKINTFYLNVSWGFIYIFNAIQELTVKVQIT